MMNLVNVNYKYAVSSFKNQDIHLLSNLHLFYGDSYFVVHIPYHKRKNPP